MASSGIGTGIPGGDIGQGDPIREPSRQDNIDRDSSKKMNALKFMSKKKKQKKTENDDSGEDKKGD